MLAGEGAVSLALRSGLGVFVDSALFPGGPCRLRVDGPFRRTHNRTCARATPASVHPQAPGQTAAGGARKRKRTQEAAGPESDPHYAAAVLGFLATYVLVERPGLRSGQTFCLGHGELLYRMHLSAECFTQPKGDLFWNLRGLRTLTPMPGHYCGQPPPPPAEGHTIGGMRRAQ